MARVETPVEGYTGKVAGVSFVDGIGETEDATALAYFARHGYTVDGEDKGSGEKPEGNAGGETEPPAGNATTEAWHAYALAQGIPAETLEGRGRDEIRALFADD